MAAETFRITEELVVEDWPGSTLISPPRMISEM